MKSLIKLGIMINNFCLASEYIQQYIKVCFRLQDYYNASPKYAAVQKRSMEMFSNGDFAKPATIAKMAAISIICAVPSSIFYGVQYFIWRFGNKETRNETMYKNYKTIGNLGFNIYARMVN